MTDLRTPFGLEDPLPSGRAVLEASAGTGKTYSLTGLIARYIAELAVPVDEILVVTFTRAAANELRERTREVLVEAAAALDGRGDPPPQSWMSVLTASDDLLEPLHRRQRILDALARYDDLTITTIHGFCQQALGQLGLRAGNDPDAVLVENTGELVREVCRDLLIVELADDPASLSSNSNPTRPSRVETDLVKTVLGVLSNPGARLEPVSHSDVDGELLDVDDDMVVARRWAALVDRAVGEVHARQAIRGQIGYDSLVTGLRAALFDGERGDVVADQLAARYRVVLVDEFQDTDRMQWDVFGTAFASGSLVTVGDPKQAIYRFRGADVHAYLDAISGSPTFDLTTNYRSDRDVLAGLEHLFAGATLGDARIEFTPVAARPDAPDTALGSVRDAPPGAAVCLRVVPQDQRLRRSRPTLAMPLVRPLVLADVVARTIDLLDNGTITEHGVARPVVPGDIAVLVPSHAEAHHVAEAMQRAGIAAVRTRTGSVLASPAVMQWRLLLTAMSRPHQASAVRAAALGWFVALGPEQLVGDDAEEVLAALQESVARLADQLRRRGVASFYDNQKTDGPLLASVLGQRDGDRHLTDLDHVAELLAEALHGSTCDAPSALRVLEDMVAADDERSETTMRRIDSDAAAVQITTIHAAKGLEYPIVLVPFSFKPRPYTDVPYSYNDANGHRVLDVASPVPWDGGLQASGDDASHRNQTTRKHDANVESDGDSLRLLYVALTRAQHRLEIWWATILGSKSSALARLLLDRTAAGPIANTPPDLRVTRNGTWKSDRPPFAKMPDPDAEAQIRDFAAATGGAIELVELPAHIEHPHWRGSEDGAVAQLDIASTHGLQSVAEPAWKRWSFTRLAATADQLGNANDGEAAMPADAEHGGNDEPTTPADGTLEVSRTAEGPAAATGGELLDVVAGTTFGTFVHSVLEELDFSSPQLALDIRTLVTDGAGRWGLRLDADTVSNGILDALRTPLGPLFGDRALIDIPPRDRLAELTFDIPLGAVDMSSPTPAASIGDILLETLPAADALRPFARQLTEQFAGIDLAGWMHGSIDAVFRVPGDAGDAVDDHRFVVVDYKTNRLHPLLSADPLTSYHPAALVPAMEHHRYPLQALLYSVGLHRYLRWRLGDRYDADRHLGGIAYLFVRGMIGPATPVVEGVPYGVFSWRPPTATIVALDELFAIGTSRAHA